ncbi:hypothetical protein AB0J74_24970 [Asanoa sp. NPDC049573]|uniref:DUF3592 domain-containing protein n=1 Tax=Asanoa sp. NPDC049573 TaxID=3155396 RepID=UPI003449ECE4
MARARGHGWPWLVVYGLLLVGGPALAVVSAVDLHADRGKRDRLLVVGVPVTATVTDRDRGSSASRDRTTVTYQVDGRTFTATVRGLASEPTMTLRVDPADPAAFLSDLGSVDGSTSGPNGVASVVWGVVLTALGFVGFVAHRRSRR